MPYNAPFQNSLGAARNCSGDCYVRGATPYGPSMSALRPPVAQLQFTPFSVSQQHKLLMARNMRMPREAPIEFPPVPPAAVGVI